MRSRLPMTSSPCHQKLKNKIVIVTKELKQIGGALFYLRIIPTRIINSISRLFDRYDVWYFSKSQSGRVSRVRRDLHGWSHPNRGYL